MRALGVPLAPLWAGAPTVTAAIHFGDWKHPLFVLMLYAGIVVVDGLALQPYLMKTYSFCRFAGI